MFAQYGNIFETNANNVEIYISFANFSSPYFAMILNTTIIKKKINLKQVDLIVCDKAQRYTAHAIVAFANLFSP